MTHTLTLDDWDRIVRQENTVVFRLMKSSYNEGYLLRTYAVPKEEVFELDEKSVEAIRSNYAAIRAQAARYQVQVAPAPGEELQSFEWRKGVLYTKPLQFSEALCRTTISHRTVALPEGQASLESDLRSKKAFADYCLSEEWSEEIAPLRILRVPHEPKEEIEETKRILEVQLFPNRRAFELYFDALVPPEHFRYGGVQLEERAGIDITQDVRKEVKFVQEAFNEFFFFPKNRKPTKEYSDKGMKMEDEQHRNFYWKVMAGGLNSF